MPKKSAWESICVYLCLCDCLHSNMETAWAINTQLGRPLACIDHDDKRSEVTGLSSALPASVCRLICCLGSLVIHILLFVKISIDIFIYLSINCAPGIIAAFLIWSRFKLSIGCSKYLYKLICMFCKCLNVHVHGFIIMKMQVQFSFHFFKL